MSSSSQINRPSLFKLCFLLLAFSFTGCASKQAPDMEAYKATTTEYLLGGQYEADMAKAYEQGKLEIQQLLEEYKNKRFVVIFDVDETVLSNKEYEFRVSYGFTTESWDKWTNEKRAPAIKPALEFYQWLLKNKITVVFSTGRKLLAERVEDDRTYKNLKLAGYPEFYRLYLRSPRKKYSLKSQSMIEFKQSNRCELQREGFSILASVGDQWSDHQGDCRAMAQIKLPNPMYSSEKLMLHTLKKYGYKMQSH